MANPSDALLTCEQIPKHSEAIAMTLSAATPPKHRPPVAARRFGYVLAALLNAVLLYAVNVWPGWESVPFLTADTALELREHNVAAISLWPGLVMTERVVKRSIVNDAGGLVAEGLELSFGESPRFSGRAITALATS